MGGLYVISAMEKVSCLSVATLIAIAVFVRPSYCETIVRSECISGSFDPNDAALADTLADLARFAVVSQLNGDNDTALQCAKRLLEVSKIRAESNWGDRVDAALLLADICKVQKPKCNVEDIFIYAFEEIPIEGADVKFNLTMAASSFADYLFVTRSPKAHHAYKLLVALSACNEVAATGLEVYKRRMVASSSWSIESVEGESAKLHCPTSKIFLCLAENGSTENCL